MQMKNSVDSDQLALSQMIWIYTVFKTRYIILNQFTVCLLDEYGI